MLRLLLAALLLIAAAPAGEFAPVRPGVALRFPADHGAHPAYRTEWWYVTGWLDVPGEASKGFQVTFFRSATGIGRGNPSRFAPGQILFAHAALSDPATGRLVHDQRVARAGFGLAEALTRDADVRIDDWRFRRMPDGRFRTRVGGQGFALDLSFAPTQPILLQGDGGYSRKGREPEQASHYYTQPHLRASGTLRRGGRDVAVRGTAWLDREWSSSILEPGAVGWDWTGINLDDGGALTAFRIRDADGATRWAGGSYRGLDGRAVAFAPGDVAFVTRRRWRSPRTGARYPVDPVVRVRLPGGVRDFPLTPLFADQELDSRGGGGPIYWEGAVRTPGGRGYLELTGYAEKLAL